MSKTIVITGATSGLGKSTAIEIAKQGNHLVLVGRNQQKGEALLTELKQLAPQNKYFYYTVNFASIEDTKRLGDSIVKNHPKIDTLLNNAGGVISSFGLTQDGFEQTIAINHLGYFVLTLKLLPNINKITGRIVNVASMSHFKNVLDFESFTQEKDYFIMKAYGQSKLANIMFTYSLVDKLKHTGITTNCLNPGMVKTNIGGKANNWLHGFAWWVGSRIKGISLKKGIRTHVFLTTSPKAAKLNGTYYNNMKREKTNDFSYDKNIQVKLWKWSEEATGIKWDNIVI